MVAVSRSVSGFRGAVRGFVALVVAVCTAGSSDGQPIALFTFDGGSLADSSGNGVIATNDGAVATADGRHGDAYRFDGSSAIRVNLDLNPWRHIRPQVTIGCWAKLEDPSAPRQAVLSTDDAGWDRAIVVDNRVDQVLRWNVFCGFGLMSGTPEPVVDEWVFLVAEFDAFTEAVRFYVDGVLHEASARHWGSFPYFEIGRNPGFPNEGFRGVIDSVFVFEGVLSPAQIALIQAGGPGVLPSIQSDRSSLERYAHDNYSPDPLPSEIVAAPRVLDAKNAIEWKYTLSDPGAAWEGVGFDDSAWAGPTVGGFAPTGWRFERDVVTTSWNSADLWLRTSVTLDETDLSSVNGAPLAFWGRWNEDVEVWINGVQAVEAQHANDDGARGTRLHRYLGLTLAGTNAWQPGENTIAVRVYTTPGWGYFDLGIVRNPFDDLPLVGYHESVDSLRFLEPIQRWAARACVPTLSFAVMRNDRTAVYYTLGHLDKHRSEPAPLKTVFRTASITKPPTRAAIHRLIEMGELNPATNQPLTLDASFWPMMEALGVSPAGGATPHPDMALMTLEHLIKHSSRMPHLESYEVADVVGRGFTPLDRAAALYAATPTGVPCDPRETHVWCTPRPPDAPCEQYSNDAYFLLRLFVELITGDFESFLEDEVVRAAEAGFDPMVVSQEDLALRHPREPWYRSIEWWAAEEERGLQGVLALSTTAEAYCHFMRRWRLFWGERMPELILCHAGYLPKGGWMGGTHTLSVQSPRPDTHIGWVILTNESGAGNFSELLGTLIDITEDIENNGRWFCDADFNSDDLVNTADFVAYINDFVAVGNGESYVHNDPDIADPIGVLNSADFVEFLNLFVAGCQ